MMMKNVVSIEVVARKYNEETNEYNEGKYGDYKIHTDDADVIDEICQRINTKIKELTHNGLDDILYMGE